MIKQYEMETNYVCHFLLDCSASMRYGKEEQQKLDYASQMIAVLGHTIVRQGDKVSLAIFDEEVRDVVAPSNAMAQIIRMSESLDRMEPVKKTHMADCLNELCGRMKRREIVMIFRRWNWPCSRCVTGCTRWCSFKPCTTTNWSSHLIG